MHGNARGSRYRYCWLRTKTAQPASAAERPHDLPLSLNIALTLRSLLLEVILALSYRCELQANDVNHAVDVAVLGI